MVKKPPKAMSTAPNLPRGVLHNPAPHSPALTRPALTRPAPLRAGDAVALFSPSSHPRGDNIHLIDEAAGVLEGWGLRPRLPEAPGRRHLYLAGTDRERAEEFQALYADPHLKALFATRGGYGAARMLPLLDRGAIAAASPKHVVGMSDLSALQAYLATEARLATVHGPCLAAPAHAASSQRAADEARLRDLLFDTAPPPPLPCRLLHNPASEARSVSGTLVGGNLAVLASLLGSPWALDTRGTILFLEEINEAPYRVDRDLTHFRLAGKLDAPAAVVFGHMRGCDGEPPGLLEQVLRDLFADAPYPVAVGLPAGHDAPNRAMPLGLPATLNLPKADSGLTTGGDTASATLAFGA